MDDLMRLIDETLFLSQQLRHEPVDERQRAQLCASWYALQQIASNVAMISQNGRVCPGPYWRTWDEVQVRIDSVLKEKVIRKKRKLHSECKATAPSFSRAECGPIRPDFGERMICDACYQQLRKDLQRGILK